MTTPVTVEQVRHLLLAADRTSAEKLLGAHGEEPQVRQWALDHGYQIVGFVFENGVSGHTPVLLREDIVRAVWRCRDEPTLAGIIWPSTDRQGRDHIAFSEMRYAMTWIGKHLYVGYIDQDGQFDVHDAAADETPMQRRLRHIRELEAEKAETLMVQTAHRKRLIKITNQAGYGGGFLKPPFFMDRVELGNGKAEFTPNRERLQWAVWMRDRRAEGWSGPRVARELNRLGVTTRDGNQWSHKTVFQVCGTLGNVDSELVDLWLNHGSSQSPARELARASG